MLPSKVRLWKKLENGKWAFYSRLFTIPPASTPASDEIAQIARMVQRGWLAYDADFKRVTDKTPRIDYDWSTVDTSEYEEKIRQIDPLSHRIGKCFQEYSNLIASRPRVKKEQTHKQTSLDFIIPEKEKKQELSEALMSAIVDYKKGLPVPSFLLQDILSNLSV
jgi:hypothetical protein